MPDTGTSSPPQHDEPAAAGRRGRTAASVDLRVQPRRRVQDQRTAAAVPPVPARSGRTLHVLLVEDSLADAELTAEMLRQALPDTVVRHAASLEEALSAAARSTFDVALVDLGLPDAEGLHALHALHAAVPGVPAIIVLTGWAEDAAAHAALGAGAQDYLVKDRLDADLLGRAVRYAVSRARAEQEVARSRLWAQSVLDSIESPTCAVDTVGTIIAVNAAWTRFTEDNGGSRDTCGVGMNYVTVCETSSDQEAVATGRRLQQLLRTGVGRVELDYPCHGPGQQRWFSMRATPVVGGGGAVLTHLDITALRQAQTELEIAAWHDPLTGLVTRRRLADELHRRLVALQAGRAVAVLFLDVDRFKLINDTLGHTAGDSVLVAIADALREAVRHGDVVARHGGDEFVVVADVSDDEVPFLADRIQAATNRCLRIGSSDVNVTTSVGLVVTHADAGETAEDLLQAVDHAMHQAKAAGKGRVELYTEDLRKRVKDRAQLLRELTNALEHEQFALHFQPIVLPDVGGVHAVEALIRWQHPRRGLLGPGAFLDVAETTGLIVPIGAWVLRAACQQGQRLHDAGLHLAVTVNLSAKQLSDPQTPAVIAEALAASGFAPSSLIIEVTETSMIEDTETALSSMQAIKALGAQVAVDDFGTGYSSLAYIKRYPVDGIKIDRGFVRDMLHNSDDRAIVASLIKLAKDLDLWVIAEGVETVEQAQALREMGCPLLQGFLYARPQAPDALPDVLRRLASRALVTVPVRRAWTAQRAVESHDPAIVARIAELSDRGMSLTTIAAALNSDGSRTLNGLRWHPRSVARLLENAIRERAQHPEAAFTRGT